MAIHLSEKPIFVIGPERSGTTLLRVHPLRCTNSFEKGLLKTRKTRRTRGIVLRQKKIFAKMGCSPLLMTMLGSHPRISVPEVAWLYPRFYNYLHTYGNLRKLENLGVLAEEMIFGYQEGSCLKLEMNLG